jgi:hypothetical protein
LEKQGLNLDKLRDEDPTNILMKLGTGDTYNVIDKPTVYQLQFSGITLGSADYDPISLTVIHQDFPVLTNVGDACTATATTLYDEYMLQVASSVKDAFQLSGDTTINAQQFYIRLGNSTESSPSATKVVFQQPGAGNCWYNMTATQIEYLASSDEASSDRIISLAAWNATETNLSIREAASSTSGITDTMKFTIMNDSDGSKKFLLATTTTKYMRYVGVTGTSYTGFTPLTGNQEPGYYTERGSQFVDMSTSGVSVQRALRLGELKFYVKSTGTTPVEGTTVGPLGEGESANVGGGVTVKVLNITETVGTCTAGGAGGSCQVTGKDQLTATPSVSTAIVSTPLNTKTAPIVVLDKDADQASTLIVVGGNLVNTVAADVMQSANIDLTTEGGFVAKAVGTQRILVAGITADQTKQAGDKFIQDLLTAAGSA